MLAASVEAFVVRDGDDLAAARKLHRAFLDEYGLVAADVPLLRFRVPAGGGAASVFERTRFGLK